MLYSLFLVTFGIFLGQEYSIPSIKKLSLNIYNSNFNNEKNVDINTDNNFSINKIFEYFNKLKKDD